MLWNKQTKKRQCVVLICFLTMFLSASTVYGANGSLKVTSFPSNAQVSIDGVSTGKSTPMSISLSEGEYEVTVQISGGGWNPDTRTVTITPGNNDLSVTLLPAITQGHEGPQGDTGPAGPKGDKGNTGNTGPAGSQGEQGPVGSAGPAGPQGEQGPVGSAGPQGEQGSVGSAGPVGSQGEQGPVGSAGPAGSQGEQGPVGSAGPAGSQGEQGPVGPAGLQGEQGPVGPAGLQGEQGPVGPAGPQGPKGDTGATGPAGPEGPAGDAAFSIEDFVASGQIGTITIQNSDIVQEGVFGIRFGISALPSTDPKSPSSEVAVDEVELILDGGNPGLLSLIENIGTANMYSEVSVTLGSNLIILDMSGVNVNSVDFFGQFAGSTYRSLAHVSFSIQQDFTLNIADEGPITYDIVQGSGSGPICSEVFNVYHAYNDSGGGQIGGGPPPLILTNADILLTDYDVQISPTKAGGPCISTITTKTRSYQNSWRNTACIWANCLNSTSIDIDTVWIKVFSISDNFPDFYLDTSFEISQAFPRRVKIYSTNKSNNSRPVQMEMTYSMVDVVINDYDPGDPDNPAYSVTVASCPW